MNTARTADNAAAKTAWSARRPLVAGAIILGIGIGGIGLWASGTKIHGAVVASGVVEVEARRQIVQHAEGGLAREILVSDGDLVEAGTPLIVLDGTALEADLRITARELFELEARAGRLTAEAENLLLVFDRNHGLDTVNPIVQGSVLAKERRLHEMRLNTLSQTLAQYDERIVQTLALIEGRERQLEAVRKQRVLAIDDLADRRTLFDRGLAAATQVSTLEREVADLEGRLGELEARIAEARSQIAGFTLERLKSEISWRTDAHAELRDLEPRINELRERKRVLATDRDRLVLRAPMRGTVLGLQIHTVGGVVPAGAEIASIVPADAQQVLRVHIPPVEIDRVSLDQSARIRFPSFNARTTPEVNGRVKRISADALSDPTTGFSYFLAEVHLDTEAEVALSGVEILPGMPVDVFIRTEPRSPASYLLKPAMDYLKPALREE